MGIAKRLFSRVGYNYDKLTIPEKIIMDGLKAYPGAESPPKFILQDEPVKPPKRTRKPR
jgi:hypothetical protein